MVCNTFYERGGFSAPLPPQGLLRGDAAFCQPSFSRSVQHQLCDSSRESQHMELGTAWAVSVGLPVMGGCRTWGC